MSDLNSVLVTVFLFEVEKVSKANCWFEVRRKATRSYLHGFALSDKYTVKFTSK